MRLRAPFFELLFFAEDFLDEDFFEAFFEDFFAAAFFAPLFLVAIEVLLRTGSAADVPLARRITQSDEESGMAEGFASIITAVRPAEPALPAWERLMIDHPEEVGELTEAALYSA